MDGRRETGGRFLSATMDAAEIEARRILAHAIGTDGSEAENREWLNRQDLDSDTEWTLRHLLQWWCFTGVDLVKQDPPPEMLH